MSWEILADVVRERERDKSDHVAKLILELGEARARIVELEREVKTVGLDCGYYKGAWEQTAHACNKRSGKLVSERNALRIEVESLRAEVARLKGNG